VTAPAIDLRGVTVTLGGNRILDRIDLAVPHGEFLGILGPNGGGKTTIAKVVLGLIVPDAGTVEVLGGPPADARGRVGYVPQTIDFDRGFPIRAIDVVLLGRLGKPKRFGPFRAVDRERAREALARVGIADLAGRQIGSMSGGQLQRVVIARALAADARVLLLDEPASNLDSNGTAALYELLAELHANLTIVLIDHDLGVMHRYVQTVACVNRTIFHGHAKDLTGEVLERVYGHPVDVLHHAHGQAHDLGLGHAHECDPASHDGQPR
jgi:zinc transport system ATP-binding protein